MNSQHTLCWCTFTEEAIVFYRTLEYKENFYVHGLKQVTCYNMDALINKVNKGFVGASIQEETNH